jgi:hypothetical protein
MKTASIGMFAFFASLASCARALPRPPVTEHTQSSARSIIARTSPQPVLDPAPVALAAPADATRERPAPMAPTRWQLANGLRVEHRRFALAATVHLRLVVRGVGSESAAGRSLRESLRLALALEEGGSRRNPAPLFAASLAQVGAELRADAGRQGLVLSLDVASSNVAFALRKLGEIASEPAVSRETGSFAEWVARRTHPEQPPIDRSLLALRRAALAALRGVDAPWSPREWSEVAGSFAWASPEDSSSRGLAREALRAGSMTLIIGGDISADEARAALAAERWPAVARGAGVALAPLAAVAGDAPSRAVYRAQDRVGVAVGWRIAPAESAESSAASSVLAAALERCARATVTTSFYDDPARSALVLATAVSDAAQLGSSATALVAEPERVMADPCFERGFDAVKTSLIEHRNPSDPARWTDVRAWAAHDGRTDESERAALDALVALTLDRARVAGRAALSTAPRVLVAGGPSAVEMALCGVSGARSVRVGTADRACP